MGMLDERERAFENLFAHDEDLRFRAQIRRNRMIGRWAAARLGKSGAQAEAYVAEIVAAGFEGKRGEGVVTRIEADLASGTHAVDANEIRAKMATFLVEAVEELRKEG
ncbi:DUF1476 domain-containing protein [Pararhizobium mangrovi]|uniref:DUF1476 domain-containing protein n=1 Tax=Pararhizobium mangrovi TaxID=2590452 RepID=A0A506U0S4_9HYPH|nr:DUF1476 domain-containing protein [Pararhizobium mangrovi]TPW26801.1 DUF1476 domain-containing protein [Pararhizobium mangrovi]